MGRIAALLAATLVVSGCRAPGQPDLRAEYDRLRREADAKNQQLVAQQTQIEELNRRLLEARAIRPDDLTRIFYPESIAIDSLSGGDDYDGQPGDDGITVYLRPLDRDGDTIKVAGDIKVQFFDLAAELGATLIGEYDFASDQVGKLWYGKLLTNHYKLKCPWKSTPPAHPDITARVTFTDFLTQRVLTAQTVLKFKPRP